MVTSVISVKQEDLEKAIAIKSFLEKHFSEHYSYDDIIRKFGMNKCKLKVAFRAIANANVYEHVTKVRIEHGKELLELTNKTICEIARKVGLDKSNFIIQFKRLTGKTPSEWRNDPEMSQLVTTEINTESLPAYTKSLPFTP
jgi:YesN/AraC family two-component response regulator